MRKFLLFLGFLTFSFSAFAQDNPTVLELPIEVTDGTSTINMIIGMRTDATDGHDSGIDQREPPPPPADFLRSYIEGGGDSYWKDYRAASTEVAQFYVVIDPKANPDQAVVIRWDNTLDVFENATVRMKHLFPGQPCFDLDMSTVDSLDTAALAEIPGNFFDAYGVLIEVALREASTGKFYVSTCEDAFVWGASAANTTNFGSNDSLRVQQSAGDDKKRESYLKFDFETVTDSIVTAHLKLYAIDVQGSQTHRVSPVEDISWTEDGLTWANKPAPATEESTWMPVQDEMTSIDITDYARAAKDSRTMLSLWLESTTVSDEIWATYASREHETIGYRPVIEIVTTNADMGSVGLGDEFELPASFQLLGNYPNPFNPTTNIVLNLRENAAVTVDVFDLLGRNLLSLPQQFFLGGESHQIQVDASSLTSGTYLYQVTAQMPAQTVVRTGRMVLLK